MKYSKTIFIGDVYECLAIEAKRHSANAWLLTADNSTEFLEKNDCDVTVYTSLGDLSRDLAQVFDILCSATTVIYCPPKKKLWSDNKVYDPTDPCQSIQGMVETLLYLLPKSVTVKGLDQCEFMPDPMPLVDQRKTQEQQIWIAGCSISHGVGVDDQSRYGTKLSQALNLPVSYLTRPGSAIDWAADQIIRSDIKPGDTVIWGITHWERLTHIDQHKLLSGLHVNTYTVYPHYHDLVPLKSLFSNQNFYNHVYAIQRVINFCNKSQCRLILVGLLQGNYALLKFLKSQQNYIHINYKLTFDQSCLSLKFVDLANDLLHPGVKQHQEYANIILDFLKNHHFSTNLN